MTQLASEALTTAASVIDRAQSVVTNAIGTLGVAGVEEHQTVAYDVAHAASALLAAREMLAYAAEGPTEAQLTLAFVADVVHDLVAKTWGREAAWGVAPGALDPAAEFVATYRDPALVGTLGAVDAPIHLDDDFAMVRDTFRRFAEDKVRPHAEHVHRTNADVPEEVIVGLAELGGFGLSIPEEYGGFAGGSSNDYLANVVATEELSRGSLGIGGSLLTRPEILTRALVRGGTEEQKKQWLPGIAAGDTLVAIAVTEPDYGSDVAGVRVAATPHQDGWLINGTKTWCTFAARADVLMLLARTDSATTNHRGLSAFVVPKPRGDGHGFRFTQAVPGRDGTGAAAASGTGDGVMEGRPIDTIGYRGMHSY
jgi:(2S)-methylsuccinyl-CoA dehydrogenase